MRNQSSRITEIQMSTCDTMVGWLLGISFMAVGNNVPAWVAIMALYVSYIVARGLWEAEHEN